MWKYMILVILLGAAHQAHSSPNLDTFLDDEDSGVAGSGNGGGHPRSGVDPYSNHNTFGNHHYVDNKGHASHIDPYRGQDSQIDQYRGHHDHRGTFDDTNFTSYDDEDYVDYGSGDYDDNYTYEESSPTTTTSTTTTPAPTTTTTTTTTTTSTPTTTTTVPPPPPSTTTVPTASTTISTTTTTTTEAPRSIIEENGLKPGEGVAHTPGVYYEDEYDDDYYDGDYYEDNYDDEDYHEGSGDLGNAGMDTHHHNKPEEKPSGRDDHFTFEQPTYIAPKEDKPIYIEPDTIPETEVSGEKDAGMDSAGGMQIVSKEDDRQVSIFAQPGILAAFIGGAVVGLLCAILLVMFVVYRMRKKDEGSYPLDEPKRVPLTSSYATTDKEIYA